MVHDALHELDLDGIDILFIENVGNLVCPASFDLGHHANVTLLSVTEGDDKPAKYPVMFRAADLMLLTKSDLLEVLDDFDTAKAERHLRELANPADVIYAFRASSGKPGRLAGLAAEPVAGARRAGADNEAQRPAGRCLAAFTRADPMSDARSLAGTHPEHAAARTRCA